MTTPFDIPDSQEVQIYDNKETIELFKRRVLYTAIRMQARGLRFGPLPRTALQVLREDYGLNYRNAKAALPAVERLVLDQIAVVKELENPR